MLKLYLMASNGYLPTLMFRPEQGFNRLPKDSQRLLPNYELREDILRSSPLNMRPQSNGEPWKPSSGLFDNNQFVMIDPNITKRMFVDIQDSCSNSSLSSFKFLMSRLIEVERDELHLSGIQNMKTDDKPYFPDMGYADSQLIYPNPEFDSQKSLMDFVRDLVRRSEVLFHEDGRVLLSGSNKTEMKDILSVVAEFYLSMNSTNWTKQSMLVPQFNRLNFDASSYYGSALELETVMVAPPKSPEKMKLKPSTKKKKNHKKSSVKHRSNYIQACESLLSIIVDKKRTGKAAIPILKKSGPELPSLLTQFSATIAGTGIAVLFSVVCKAASSGVPPPLSSSRLINTGLGIGLVWVSWAVNKLRDTIVMINKNSSKKSLKDEEMMKKLDKNVKEIYFRAATLMAVMMLRLG